MFAETEYAKTSVAIPVMPAPSQFIGRQRELEVIRRQFKAASDGRASVVFLVGEQGVGKSRLLLEFAKYSMVDGATVLWGGAFEAEGMPPYLPFIEALGRHIREAPLDELRQQVELAPQILASILPELVPRLVELPTAYPLPPEQMRLRLYEAVGTFLEKISASQTLVLALDDLHWADSGSLDLLCHIARTQSNARLLVLGTCREDETERNPAFQRTLVKLVQQRLLMRIAVEPLAAEEIAALAANYLDGRVSANVSRPLFAQSEGNPFFAEELLRSWVERGEIARENELWSAVAPLEHTLPQSIVGVLRQRFSRLSPATVDCLRIASIIGRTFELSLLAALESQEAEILEEYLLEAVRADLIRREQSGIFSFSHDKIRECLYAEVSTSRRRRLHEAIGRVFEARYSQESLQSVHLLSELAFHFTQSNDIIRALTYSLQAAEHARLSSAFKEAVTYYHLALELLPANDARRGDLLLGLGEAAFLDDSQDEAAAAYNEALALFLAAGEREAAAQAAHGLALAQWQQGSLRTAKATLEHALALLGDKQSARQVRVLVDLAKLLTNYMDHQVEGMTYAQRALEVALRMGDSSLEASANRAVAGKLFIPGNDIASALRSLERALELAEASDDVSESVECCLALARAYYWLAEVGRSDEVSSHMVELIERSQHHYQLRNALPWLALIRASRGSWAEAQQAIERVQPIVEHMASPFPSALMRQVRGFLAYQQEDYETAEDEFQAVSVDQGVGPERLMFFTGLLGLTQATLGKREEAHAYAARLEGLLSVLPAGSLPTAPIMTCQALMALALGDRTLATNLYPLLKAFRGQHYWFLVDRVLGQLATILRDWDAATTYLDAAEETARREDLRPELARSLLARANLEVSRRGQGSIMRATESLDKALALFEQLNMPGAAARTRSRLRALSQRSIASQLLPADLTNGEAKVLQLVVKGKSNRQIARDLGISEKTVANHLSRIFAKTASENRAAAAAFAIRHKLD